MTPLSGHLGDRVAALVDDQLDEVEAERAWHHVLCCPGCREAVEEQAATKQLLGSLRDEVAVPTSSSWLSPEALEAWHHVAELEHRSRRRAVVVGGLVGGGALTASLAVAVAVGGLGVTTPATRPDPSRVVAGIHATETTPTVARSTAAPAAPSTWTGTAVGGETSRAFRTDRSR